MKIKKRLAAVGLIFSLIALIFGGGRSPTTVYADTVEHTHIWADKYDSSNHWKYCTVCGAVKDKEAHTFTDHWYLGKESCNGSNYSRRICNCGYSYIYHKPHSETYTTNSHTYYERQHWLQCSKCGDSVKRIACYDDDGPLTCSNPGTCKVCGGTSPANHHQINSQGICVMCKKKFFTIADNSYTYSSDYSYINWQFKVIPVDNTVKVTGTNIWCNPGTCSRKSGQIIQNTDGSYTLKFEINILHPTRTATVMWSYDNVTINGSLSWVNDAACATDFYRDHQAPVQNDVVQKDQASANGWATIKQLTLSGTEDFSDIVYLTVSDKATGEKCVTDAAVPVTDGKYSYTCTPSIEGDANGRTYVVTAKDRIGNTSTKESVVSKTDGSAPQLKSGTSLTYTDWSTSKNISLSFFDFGAGGVEASLDNQTDYKALTKSGEYYVWNHTFGNQVGTTEHMIYVKDALGNAGSYKFTVGNTDNTAYSISYNLNGGSLNGQKTSYTVADSFTLPTPTKTGYTFTGWTGSNGTTLQKTVTVSKGTRGNLSYTANWEKKVLTTTFHRNRDASDTVTAVQKYTYGVDGQTFSDNGFDYPGYKLSGYDLNKNAKNPTWSVNNGVAHYWIDKQYPANDIYAIWNINTYTNDISHWLRGFKNREGNNGSGDAFYLADTYFSATYKSSFVMDSSRTTKIPNGCYVNPSESALFWKDGVHWSNAIYGTITQEAYNMHFQYGYRPYNYSITYNLNGGTNNSANPSTYTVLYGVSLKAPTRVGYTFTGWYDESGNKITGINEGCNATFSSTDDLYVKLATRTTGNKTLTAHWSYNPVSVKVPQVLTGNHTGTSQFRVKCDDMKAGNIKITVPNSFSYKQAGKTDVAATITSKSGNNTITPANKVCVYNITTKNGLSAGCWQGSFNIGLTLTKE